MKARDARGGEWTIRVRRAADGPELRLGSLDWRGPDAQYRNVHYHESTTAAFKAFVGLPVVAVHLLRRSIVRRRSPWVVEAQRNSLKRRTLRWDVASRADGKRVAGEVARAFEQGRDLGGATEVTPPGASAP